MAGESKLQRKIIQDLKIHGWITVKIVLCNIPGFNDIVAFRNKVTIFLEIKDEGEKPKPLQVYRHKILRAQGFSVFTIDTWEQYKQIKSSGFKSP